ncbi:hypothetical protein V8G54_028974, partial [Vigna mungo]
MPKVEETKQLHTIKSSGYNNTSFTTKMTPYFTHQKYIQQYRNSECHIIKWILEYNTGFKEWKRQQYTEQQKLITSSAHLRLLPQKIKFILNVFTNPFKISFLHLHV